MTNGRRGRRQRPSGRAVAGRLMGAFVAGLVVMGGMLYLFDHSRTHPRQQSVGRAGAQRAAEIPAAGTIPGEPASSLATGRSPAVPGAGTSNSTASLENPSADQARWPQAPFGESEEVFETGGRVYAAQCSTCHGSPKRVQGSAAQFWGAGAAAVASAPVGKTYLAIARGVPPGMKGYAGQLPETEMWDVALLLRNAGQELPDPVVHLLRRP